MELVGIRAFASVNSRGHGKISADMLMHPSLRVALTLILVTRLKVS